MVPTRQPARRFLPVSLVVGLLLVATACIPPDDLQVTTVVSNLSQPWDIGFTPDGTMLYTEKPGRIDAMQA
jgi:glucose/arabinose dehydrogenase